MDVRSLAGAAAEPPPQLNLQITFRHVGEPLHVRLLRPHLPAADLEELRVAAGRRSVLSPSEVRESVHSCHSLTHFLSKV